MSSSRGPLNLVAGWVSRISQEVFECNKSYIDALAVVSVFAYVLFVLRPHGAFVMAGVACVISGHVESAVKTPK